MNKIYRVIWNALLQRFVVASELAKGKVKSQSASNTSGTGLTSKIAFSSVALVITVALSTPQAFATETIIANGTHVVADGQDIVATGNRASVGQKAMGLSAGNNGSIAFSNGTLTTSGSGGLGAIANNSASITLLNTQIKTSGSQAQGLTAQNSGKVSGDGVTVATGGEKSHGLYTNTGGEITLNNSEIAATGHMAVGAWAEGVGSVININDSTISTGGSSAEAVYAKNGATINITNSDITTTQMNSYGLRTYDQGSTINLDGGTVTTLGPTATAAIYVALNSNANIKNATINSSATGASVIAQGGLTLENVVMNNSGAADPEKLYSGVTIAYAGSVFNAKNLQMNLLGDNTQGIQTANGAAATLENVEVNVVKGLSGMRVLTGSSLSGDNVRINVSSDDNINQQSGLWMGGNDADGDNKAELSNSTITVNNPNSTGLLFNSNATSSNNNLLMTDSLVSAEQSTAVMVTETANANINVSGTQLIGKTLLSAGVGNSGTVSNVTLTGDNGSLFKGDILVDRANTATNLVNLNNNSLWQGATTTLANLNIASGSQWDVTRSSQVDNLTLDNATLNLTSPGSGFSEVTIGSFNSNNGTVAFKTHLAGDESVTDDLHITGDYNGNSNVVVQNAGGTGAKTLNGIALIKVDGAVNGTFTQQGRIVAGAYDYRLVQQGNSWSLRNDVAEQDGDLGSVVGGGAGEATGGEAGVNPGTPVRGIAITRPEAGSYTANLAAANTLFFTTLYDRLGETHYVDAQGQPQVSSIWMRNQGGHTRSGDSSGQLKTTGNRYVLQLGGDIAQWSSSGDDRFHLGVMAGYANAQSRTQSKLTGYTSKAQINGYSAGVYGNWVQNNADKTGAYADSWVLYNWFNNSVESDAVGSESYKSKGITAATEVGYTLKVWEAGERRSVYVQPKAQLGWMGVKADDHKEGNGTRIKGEGANNVQSRLGVRAYLKGHNSIDDGKNRTFEPFIEANWIHNTEAFGTNMNGVSIQQAGARNIAEVKVGVDARLGQKVNLWGNISQQSGDKSYSDTGAMVGVKVSF